MSEAVAAYRQVSASPEFREYERIRSKARHDEAQALYNAELTGKRKGAAEERQKWQDVVADKDALIEELLEQLGKK